MGAPTGSGDRAVLRYFVKDFAVHGYRVTQLFRSIANSEVFAQIAPEHLHAARSVPRTSTAQDSKSLIVLAH